MQSFTRRFRNTAPTPNANLLKEMVAIQKLSHRKPKRKSLNKVVQKAFLYNVF